MTTLCQGDNLAEETRKQLHELADQLFGSDYIGEFRECIESVYELGEKTGRSEKDSLSTKHLHETE